MSVIAVNEENFELEVLKADKPVLADFNAEWCGPCRMLKPVLEEIASEVQDYKVVSINIDDSDSLAAEYDVSSIPCLVVFKDGKEVSRNIGFKPKAMIEDWLGEEK